MSQAARSLLKALAETGMCSADQLGMTQTELRQAIADLGGLVDDDNRPVAVVNTWRIGTTITAVELTHTGRGIARSAF